MRRDGAIAQAGPAPFTVTFTNNGNVALSITADDGIGTFDLAVGQTKSFSVSLAGPFSGSATAANTVSASSTYTDGAGTPKTVSHEASASCRVGSRVNVVKLTQGVIDPTKTWTFSIWSGTDSFGSGSALASSSTNGDADGILEFGNVNLDRLQAYTLCEESVPPAGRRSGGLTPTTTRGGRHAHPVQPQRVGQPAQDLGNRCVDFGAGTGVNLLTDGGTLLFQVNNTYPGGGTRTPGYWKNWNRVTTGGQADNADRNGGWANGYWLLEDVLDPAIGGGIVWDDILAEDGFLFAITNPKVAVDILDQRDVADPNLVADGPKHSSDAAYTLAMHLLAASSTSAPAPRPATPQRTPHWPASSSSTSTTSTGPATTCSTTTRRCERDYNLALQFANALDKYNNGLCAATGRLVLRPEGRRRRRRVADAAGERRLAEPDRAGRVLRGRRLDRRRQRRLRRLSMPWNSTSVADGSRTLLAVATDQGAMTGSGDVVVIVDNLPDPILSPLTWA